MCAHIVGSVRKVMPPQGVRITTAAGRVCRVPAGDFCCISFIVPHRDAAVFPEPLAFKPDRHLPTQQQLTSTTAAAVADSSSSDGSCGANSSNSANTTAAAAAATASGVENSSDSSTDEQSAAAVASVIQQQQGCVPHAGLWHYSAGAHRCPGEHFAGLLMRTVVWTLASRYDMQVCRSIH
jgi:cytochrome P450